MADKHPIDSSDIGQRILIIRNQQVMIDRDLAELYGVETKRLNEQVKRNIERFPSDFMFQLSKNEMKELVANCDRFINLKHSSVNSYVFTEQGVAMLSAVLKSETAVTVSIQIMKAFVTMRHFLTINAQIFHRLDSLETHVTKSDRRIDELFDKMDTYGIEQKQGVFFQGQIFDSYSFFQKLIQKATSEIILIDGYVDLYVLDRLSQKKKNVSVQLYTQQNPKMKSPAITNLDILEFNKQYPSLSVHYTNKVHDRFLVIDHKELYHIGASIKDLGQKCFAFELMEDSVSLIPELLSKIQ